MEVRVCRRCKKMYQHISGPSVCPQCKKKEEEMFQKVKEYLRENPGASMQEVSIETDTPVGLIESFLRQGRLQIAPGSPITLSCESCGIKILSGRYCDRCSSAVNESINDMAKELNATKQLILEKDREKGEKDKMRFLQSDKIK
ncbi:hypothetical protein CS063_13445 [Sporanaerobium hydrogeniformans]|uniref:Uncharacterized protein n=1 Tax=Sporanaerobium hydrogeniformans TaxID=3072179 RepID=A0AC61DAQ4_9FIRM|nr:hypothetical protein [Sporanaerobium hydrogeniformans]PHV69838.1 hypothetical protein CS063_13445 [Sporanaerobium hydrogeniformans]